MQTLNESKHIPPKIVRMADVEKREIHWLWYPYIPFGAATMLFGPGGKGKSHITCDISARVTTGEPFPGQTDRRPPGDVLMMSAEDDMGAVLRPRLEHSRADLSRVFCPDETFVLDKQGVRDMADCMAASQATVVFIDPIVAYMGGKIDMNKMNEVRELTGALHKAAQETGTAVVIVHHSRKGHEGEDYEKAAGSGDFNNAVRSSLFVCDNPNGDGRLMRHVKSNYGPLGKPIGYSFDEDGFRWGITYDEDPTTGTSGGRQPKRSQAKAWLRNFLKDGAVLAIDVLASGKDAGFSKNTLQRAKEALAESYAVRINGEVAWWWKLREDAE